MTSMWARLRAAAFHSIALLAACTAMGASDTWNQFGGTNSWTNAANWVSGTQYPNGIGDVVYLTADITANQQINLDVAITAGVIVVGDVVPAATTNNYNIGKGTSGSFHFNNGGSAALVSNLVAANTFLDQNLFNISLAGDLRLYAASGSSWLFFSTTFTHTFSGGNDIIKSGPGAGNLGRISIMSFTGEVVVLDGSLSSGRLPNDRDLTLYQNTTYQFADTDTRIGSLRGRGTFLSSGVGTRFVVGTNAAGNFPTARWVLTDDGEIRPGDEATTGSVGSLAFNTSAGGHAFLMTNNGTLYIDMTGTVAAASDKLNVVRSKVYIDGGILNLHPTGGYVPQTGDVHTVVQALVTDSGCFETNVSLFDSIECDTCPDTIGWQAFLTNLSVSGSCAGSPTELRVKAYFIPPGSLMWIR